MFWLGEALSYYIPILEDMPRKNAGSVEKKEMLLEAALPWNTLPFRTAWPTFLAVASPCQLS